ncbi:M1-specific T cell receptor beta chain-like isoform X5 [Genypterus blacodes]|uniref:M1-specific T cell receptor beta chain-like isoform X5 n=1 Tax=Genypterus blacodes TaxID=154954 RepID=UPI003F764E80
MILYSAVQQISKHIMIFLFLSITLNIVLVSGSSLSDKVNQTPAHMCNNPGQTAKISCSHSIQNYDQILWYKQTKNRQLQLLGYMLANAGYPETGQNVSMGGSADKDKTSTLTIEGLSLNSSGVYFCAATQCDTGREAYFGKGAKLTVLEPDHDVTPPTVQVFKPSEKECKVKTLVCVASGFYPDHVSVSWEVDGVTETDSVATDNTALREGKHYSLSSRLTVQSKTWFKPSRTFTCRVSFFNGTDTIDVEDSITGETDSGGMPNDTKMKIMQNAKLTYSVLIAKSFIYGVFIMFLVWKLKGLSGKQSSRERSCGLNN